MEVWPAVVEKTTELFCGELTTPLLQWSAKVKCSVHFGIIFGLLAIVIFLAVNQESIYVVYSGTFLLVHCVGSDLEISHTSCIHNSICENIVQCLLTTQWCVVL